MPIIPINSSIKIEDYWQMQAQSIEWLYVLQKLKDSVQAKDADQHCLVATGTDGSVTYLLSKKFYTAKTISEHTGLDEAKLEHYVGIIYLKQPKDSKSKPDATVNYWGIA